MRFFILSVYFFFIFDIASFADPQPDLEEMQQEITFLYEKIGKLNENERKIKLEFIELTQNISKYFHFQNEKIEEQFGKCMVELEKEKEALTSLINSKTEVNSQRMRRTNQFLENKTGPKIDKEQKSFEGPSEAFNLSSDTLVFTWKINLNFDSGKTRSAFTYPSEIFPLPGYNRSASAAFSYSETTQTLTNFYFGFEKKHENDTLSSWRTLPRVTYRLKDRTGSDERKDFVHGVVYGFGASLDLNNWFYRADISALNIRLNKWFEEPYLDDQSIVLEVHVEPPEVAKHGHSYDGVLNGSIENFNRIAKWFKKGFISRIIGPYFYTGLEGYRVGVFFNMSSAGDKSNRWLTVNLNFLTAENDSNLSNSFLNKFTFTIFSHKHPSLNIVKFNKTCDFKQSFVIDIPTDIDSFVVNDTLRYQVVVQVY